MQNSVNVIPYYGILHDEDSQYKNLGKEERFMSKINSFLQKMKMHESRHGIIMVIAAYALSFLMLILGSDVFYNIKSAAAGIDHKTNEETQQLVSQEIESQEIESQEIESPRIMSSETLVLHSNLINPYGVDEIARSEASGKTVQLALTEDTNSLNPSNVAQYNINLMEQTLKASTLVEKPKETKDETVESLSVANEASSTFLAVTKKEVGMLERIVEAEASGEDMIGKILIANVIFNRMADEEFPDSVEKVIFQKVEGSYQFSPISDERYWTVNVSEDTEEAVQRALEGEDYSEGALYFMSRKRANHRAAEWFDNQLEWLFKHGGHEFYKNN